MKEKTYKCTFGLFPPYRNSVSAEIYCVAVCLQCNTSITMESNLYGKASLDFYENSYFLL